MRTIPVSPRDCSSATLTHHTRYGKLSKHSQAEWRKHTSDSYRCKWMKTKTKTYTHFRIIAYPAQLTGNNIYIQQHLTHTHCRYARHHCRPREMKCSMIVWHPIRHDSRLYHSLGNYTADQIDNYILIPSLGISGTVEQTRGKSIAILDTGYILVRLKLINGSLAKIE